MTDERKNEIWRSLPADFKEWVKTLWESLDADSKYKDGYEQAKILRVLFGSHNLTTQAEEKPKEPRFKVGDKVLYCGKEKIVQTIVRYGTCCIRYEVSTPDGQDPIWLNEVVLEPYTPQNVKSESESDEQYEKSDSSSQNFTIRTENGISDSKIQSESAESVESSTKEDAYFAYRLDLAKEIAVAVIQSDRWDFHSCDPVEQANWIVKRLKEIEI